MSLVTEKLSLRVFILLGPCTYLPCPGTMYLLYLPLAGRVIVQETETNRVRIFALQ